VKDIPNVQKIVEATLPKDQMPNDVAELGEPERDPSCFDKLRGRRVIIISSTNDPIIPLSLVYAVTKQLDARQVPFQLIKFDGRHSIYPEILEIYKNLY
jgi:predicted esterase